MPGGLTNGSEWNSLHSVEQRCWLIYAFWSECKALHSGRRKPENCMSSGWRGDHSQIKDERWTLQVVPNLRQWTENVGRCFSLQLICMCMGSSWQSKRWEETCRSFSLSSSYFSAPCFCNENYFLGLILWVYEKVKPDKTKPLTGTPRKQFFSIAQASCTEWRNYELAHINLTRSRSVSLWVMRRSHCTALTNGRGTTESKTDPPLIWEREREREREKTPDNQQ